MTVFFFRQWRFFIVTNQDLPSRYRSVELARYLRVILSYIHFISLYGEYRIMHT